MVESQSVVQSVAAGIVVKYSSAVEDTAQEAAIVTNHVPVMPSTESFAQSKLVDTSVNLLSVQLPSGLNTDLPALSMIIESWSQGTMAGKQSEDIKSTVFTSFRDESSFTADTTGKRVSASAINKLLVHSRALQTIVLSPNRNSTDAEAVLDVARHVHAWKHASQLEDALDRIMAEEDTFLHIQ
jgi:hypothetical protein